MIEDTNLASLTQKHYPVYKNFIYTGRQKIVKFTQFIKNSPEQQALQKVFYLDQQLSIIQTIKKGSASWENNVSYENKEKEGIVRRIIEEDKRGVIFSRQYEHYQELNDFIIGRQYWGRTCNSLRIASQLISRTHTKIIYNKLGINQERKKLETNIQTIKKQAHFSDPLRKIPKDIWFKIFQYATSEPWYSVMDCGSRNDTFIIQTSKIQAQIHQKYGYQFQNQDYCINIKKVIHETGDKIHMQMVLSQDIYANNHYNINYVKLINLPKERTLQDIMNTKQQKFFGIYFIVDFSATLKYCVWIVNSGEQDVYKIGQGHRISVFYNQDQWGDSHCHGKIIFKNKKWYLHPTTQSQRIWVKIPALMPYRLDTSKQYKIRLGHLHMMKLSFINYGHISA